MPLECLLDPKSIAILGASDRPSIGRALVESLDRMRFAGKVFAVNPRYTEVLGRRCYPSVAALPAAPDAVALCVSHARVLDGLEDAAAKGARAAVIYDGGFAERGPEGRALQERVVAICRAGGMALAGPNCMGILNPLNNSTLYLHEVREAGALAGNVGLISQSGSICIGMLADLRRFGYSHVISSGNEAVIGLADYLDALIAEPETEVIALFVESVREPERFVAALDRAASAGKPVVVLKVGRSARTRNAITSHTGGLAGESQVFSEVLRAHRAIEVDDLDEFAEVIAACQGTVVPSGARLGVVTASGGQAELILDLAEACGLDLPPLPEDVRAEAERVIGPLTGDGNPLDAWGSGNFRDNFPHALATLDADPECDAVVLCSDASDHNPMGRADRSLEYAQLLVDAAARSRKPHFLMGMRPGVMSSAQLALMRQHRIAVIGGIRQGLGAIARLARWAASPAAIMNPREGGGETLAALLADGTRATINEADAKKVLTTAGLPVARESLARTIEEAVEAGAAIGYPLVLKIVSDDIAHKTEYGLVIAGINDAESLRAAWRALETRVADHAPKASIAGYLVQELVRDGIEVFAGVTRDRDYGLMLAFGLGGTAIEVMRDFSLRALPLRAGDARAMIRGIRGAALLDGARTTKPYDVDSLVTCIEALAAFADAEREWLGEIDLNPIIVLPAGRGCRVVDALIIPRKTV